MDDAGLWLKSIETSFSKVKFKTDFSCLSIYSWKALLIESIVKFFFGTKN